MAKVQYFPKRMHLLAAGLLLTACASPPLLTITPATAGAQEPRVSTTTLSTPDQQAAIAAAAKATVEFNDHVAAAVKAIETARTAVEPEAKPSVTKPTSVPSISPLPTVHPVSTITPGQAPTVVSQGLVPTLPVPQSTPTATKPDPVAVAVSSGTNKYSINGATIEILFVRVQPHESRNLSFFSQCNTDCQALVIKVEIQNVSRTPLVNASPLSFELRSAGGQVHKSLPFVVDSSEQLRGGFLYPGDKTSGVISFGVPRNIKLFTLTYRELEDTLNIAIGLP